MTLGSTAKSDTDSVLVGSTLHRYRVLARDAEDNESPLSNEVSRTVDSTALTVPSTLRVVSATSSVALTWGASSDLVGVTNYLVYRDGLPLITLGSTARSYTDSALVGNTLHRYQVTARDAVGNESAKSNEVARTLGDTTVPVAPRLSGSLSGLTARLTWTGASDNVGVTGYTVYRGGVAIATTNSPSYTDLTPPLARASSYNVRARDATGNLSAASNTVSVNVPADKTAPSAPGGLRATVGAAGTRRITLTWNASTDNVGVTSYYLYRGNAKYRLLGKVTTFTDTGLTAGTNYTYKVYALDAASNWSGSSGNVSATAR
jgi:fibronectin type 3 domain-containing protein